jgi:acyl-CoA dehydrogenase
MATDQSLVAELVGDVLNRHHDDGLWEVLEELGLTLAAVPEALGGSGGTAADEFTILRAAGAHAVTVPLLETALAGWLLAAANLPLPSGPIAVGPVRAGDRVVADGGRLQGTVSAIVPAARLVVSGHDRAGGPFIAVVPSDGVETAPASTAGDARLRVVFHDSPATVVAVGTDPDQLLLRGALGRCTMIVGALGTVRDLTVEYTGIREQFGRPIRRFQVVQHQLAVLVRELALAEAVTDAAIGRLLAHDTLAFAEVAAAKVVCGKAAMTVAAVAHQLHGAIGITREHPLSTLTRRLLAWRADFGGERYWSQALGQALGAADPWELISATGSHRCPTP